MGHVMTRAAYTASGGFIDDDDEGGLFPLIDSVILDSGATVHIFNDRSRFISFREPASNDVCTAGTQTVPIRGWGSVMIQVTRRIDGPDSRAREVKVPIRLDEVAYIPNFNVNAAALRRFIRKGIHWDTEGQQLKFRGKNWANAPDIEQQWVLEYNPPKPRQLPEPTSPTDESAFTASAFPARSSHMPLPDKKAPAKVWHRIMGHLNRSALERLPEMTTGCQLTDREYDPVCEGYELKRATQIISRRPRI